MNIMSFKLKIFGEITWERPRSSSRKSVPTETCNHLFGEQMGSIQDYSTASSL